MIGRLAFVLLFGLAASAAAAEGRWPLFAGSLSGELTPFGEEGPRFRWQLVAAPPEEGQRRFTWRIEGDVASAHGSVVAVPSTGVFTWRIDEAVVPLAAWLPSVSTRFALPLDGVEAEGRVHGEGEGTWDGTALAGTVRVRWEDGLLRHREDDWELGGIQANATYALDGSGEAEISVGSVRYGPLLLKAGELAVRLGADMQASISRLEIQGLGGRIAFNPFVVPISEPAATVTIRMSQIAMQDLVALLPDALAEARGRLDGEVGASWSAADGLRLGAGWLALSEGSEASVRLTPTPGLITRQLDESNPAFAPLQRVELGRTTLDVSLLRARFTPQGDVDGRTATLRLQAEPVDPQLKAPLVIDVNIAGPLDQLIKLGMDGRIRF